jgi:hypothetical protein
LFQYNCFKFISNLKGTVPMKEKFIKTRQLAKRWGIDAGTLRQWRWYGKGPYFIKIGSSVVYSLEDIQRFEALQRRQHTASTPLEDNRWGESRKRDYVPETVEYVTDDEDD